MAESKKRMQQNRDRYRIIAPEDVGTPSYHTLELASRQGNLTEDVIKQLRLEYLACCLHHVKAEYWGMFSKGTQESKVPGWRMRNCCPYLIDGTKVADADCDAVIKTAKRVRQGSDVVDPAELMGHLCIWRDNLFLVHAQKLSCGCRPNSLNTHGGCSRHRDAQTWLLMRKLRPMLPDYPDPDAAKHNDRQSMLYSMGSVLSYLKTMTLIELMQSSMEEQESSVCSLPEGAPNLPILDAICHPKSERAMHERVFNIGMNVLSSPFNKKPDVELRPEQLSVIHKLRRKLEVIEGPPGTGKSTTIRAIIRRSLPHEELAARSPPLLRGPSRRRLLWSRSRWRSKGWRLRRRQRRRRQQRHRRWRRRRWTPTREQQLVNGEQTLEGLQNQPIDNYLVIANERDRNGYPDEERFGEMLDWVSTVESMAVFATVEGTDADEQNLVALHCEMVETVSDPSAIARVSVVAANGVVLYDTFVKPPKKIIGFRNISKQSYPFGTKVTLADVQERLLQLLTRRTIVVGHSLGKTFASLKLLHKRVVDVALLYPHPNGLPNRHSLAGLCMRFLQPPLDHSKEHDSVHKAQAAMRLALLKFEKGPSFGLPDGGSSVTLLIAVQNKAIDVLVRGMEPFVDNDPERSEVGMLVVGSESNPNMGEVARKYTLDSLVLQNEDYHIAFKEYQMLQMKMSSQRSDITQAILEAKEDELTELKSIIIEQIMRGVRIVFSTMAGVCSIIVDRNLRGQLCPRITLVIVDEAGTVPECEMPLVACLPAVKRLALIGDTKQLPPFSHLRGCSTPQSFMERVQQQLGVGPDGIRMLTRQFRMSAPICKFVSDSFYDGRLVMDDTRDTQRTPKFVQGGGLCLSGIYWLDYSARPPTHMLQDVVYQDERGTRIEISSVRHSCIPKHCGLGHCEETRFNSFANATEIFQIISTLELLCKHDLFVVGPKSKTVAVICFYKLQCDVLEASLRQSKFAKTILDAKESHRLSLKTVDSFQGSESDIVILSGVRSNKDGNIGFLASRDGKKRICVATSRAKEALIIVADKTTLARPKQPLAFLQLWNAQSDAGYNLRKMQTFEDLVKINSAAAARLAEDNLLSDLFA